MAGAPGSGKSTLARAIAHAREAVVIDSDVVKSALLESGVAWAQAGAGGYAVLFALADDLLAQGTSVIIDSPSHYPNIPARGIAIAQRHGVPYRFIECTCADEIELERRLLARAPRRSQMRGLGEPPPDAGGQPSPAKRISKHLWETCRPPEGYLSVDTALPLETYLGTVLSFCRC